MNEFDIIKKYFNKPSSRADVICGIGDDAAIVHVPAGQELVITTDTLVENIHFPVTASPFDIGYKSLAVNLSDLAAMGATPAWAVLALTLPKQDADWLQAFCAGFFKLALEHKVQLIGGDLTRGPLCITVQLLGLLPAKKALLRSQAKPDDLIYITGTLGDAGLALKSIQENKPLTLENKEFVLDRLNRPTPRVQAGMALRSIAHAAIDISDGLAADLNHILTASEVGAVIHLDQLPLSLALKSIPQAEAIALALTAGDDFELCFTIPKTELVHLQHELAALCAFTCIGMITEKKGLSLRYPDGREYENSIQGYQHF